LENNHDIEHDTEIPNCERYEALRAMRRVDIALDFARNETMTHILTLDIIGLL
jgi:hypothetical protein